MQTMCVWCGSEQSGTVTKSAVAFTVRPSSLKPLPAALGKKCPNGRKKAPNAFIIRSSRAVRFLPIYRTPASHGPLGTPGTAGGLAAIFGTKGGEERKWTRLSLDDDQRGEQKTRWHHHRRVGSCQRVQPGKTNFKLHEKWA